MKHQNHLNMRRKTGMQIPAIVRGLLWMAICFAGFLFLFAFAAYLLKDPLRYTPYFAPAILVLTGFCSGFAYARCRGHGGIVCGALMGGILLFLLLLFSILFQAGEGTQILLRAMTAGLAALASVTGGYCASHRKRRPSNTMARLTKLRGKAK